MSIPNPISLLQLRECYDTFLSDVKENVRSLRVVCSILWTLLEGDTRWKDRLQQTARRCYLIEQYLVLQKGNIEVDDGEEEELLLFPISVQPTLDATTWAWSIAAQQQEDIVLSMDREELANEEAALWEMANTPIPLENNNNNNDDDRLRVDRRKVELIQQIRSEWFNDAFQ